MSLRIDKLLHGHRVLFLLSGRIQASDLAELRSLILREPDLTRVVLDLKEIGLVDRQAVRFLLECQAQGIAVDHVPAYVLEWMAREDD